MIGTMTRTGRIIDFGEISIGSPFYYMERFWVRTARTAGTELHATNVSRRSHQNISSCSFEDRDDETPWDEPAKGWLKVEEVEFVFG
jgi:hypothetical protein